MGQVELSIRVIVIVIGVNKLKHLKIIAKGQVELSNRVIVIIIGVNKLKHDYDNC